VHGGADGGIHHQHLTEKKTIMLFGTFFPHQVQTGTNNDIFRVQQRIKLCWKNAPTHKNLSLDGSAASVKKTSTYPAFFGATGSGLPFMQR